MARAGCSPLVAQAAPTCTRNRSLVFYRAPKGGQLQSWAAQVLTMSPKSQRCKRVHPPAMDEPAELCEPPEDAPE
eukprot:14992481-Alexandrium_andersonii.AAC.1